MDWHNSEHLGDFHNCMIRNKAEMPTGASHLFPWAYPCPPEAQLGSEQREQLSWNTFSEHFFFIFNVIYLCYGHWDHDKKTLEEAKQSPRVNQTRDTEWRVSNDGMFYMRLLPQLGEVLLPLPPATHSVFSNSLASENHDYCPSSATQKCGSPSQSQACTFKKLNIGPK